MNYKGVVLSLFIGLFCWDCKKDDSSINLTETEILPNGDVVYNYLTDDSDFPNPDRGFYRFSSTVGNGEYNALNESWLNGLETPSFTSSSNYSSVSTLVFRHFVLDDFVDSPISDEFLIKMQQDFDLARKAGVKLIPRFAYVVETQSGDCPEQTICPPYGDASKDIIINHIKQVGPYLFDNADVITCVQMGFIGIWGENFYTDYFGGFDENGNDISLTDSDWENRIEVLAALLNELPDDIMVQVRYPQLKQRYLNGVDALTSTPAINASVAFGTSEAARIAFHNDCLLASENDQGTFVDFGNSSSPEKDDTNILKSYQAEEGKFVIIGGETCSDNYSPQNDCSPLGIADIELREQHYSFLNADFDNEVNNDWQDGGCMQDIKKNLGYRFTMSKGTFPSEVTKGSIFNISIDIENYGYASPVRARDVNLILKNSADGKIYSFPFSTDIRTWYESVSLKEGFTVPSDMPVGNYELFLHLADNYESIANRPEYSIRLANRDVWDSATGYNKLEHILSVD